MANPSPPRLQFSLRWLFVTVAASAVCALVYRVSGPVETAGVAVSFILSGIYLKMPPFRYGRLLRGVLLGIAIVVVWMVGVDYSRFHDECDHCGSRWDVEEVRVFHQPVWSRKGEDVAPSLRLIAEDLGAPCPHEYHRWHRWRLWGFFWPGPPFINGILGLSGGDWYLRENRDYVRSLGGRDPKIGKEFQAALLNHDYNTVQGIISQVRPPPKSDAGVK